MTFCFTRRFLSPAAISVEPCAMMIEAIMCLQGQRVQPKEENK